jgi:hypothetical protein
MGDEQVLADELRRVMGSGNAAADGRCRCSSRLDLQLQIAAITAFQRVPEGDLWLVASSAL